MANKLPTQDNKGQRRKSTAPVLHDERAEQLRVRTPYDISRPIHQIIPVVLSAVALFLFICFFFDDSGALVGDLLRSFFFGMFGKLTTCLVPFATLAFAFSWRQSVRSRCTVTRLVSTLLMLCLFSCLVYTTVQNTDVIRVFDLEEAYMNDADLGSGGVIGNTLSFLLVNLFDKVGTFIFCVVIFIVFAILSFGFTPSVIAQKIRDRAAGVVAQKAEERRAIRDEKQAKKEELRKVKQEMRLDEQRIRIAAKNEEDLARYEDKIEQKKTRAAQRAEERRRQNEFETQMKQNKRAARAHFMNEFDIALDDDVPSDGVSSDDAPSDGVPSVGAPENKTNFAVLMKEDGRTEQSAGGEITTHRADNVLRDIKTPITPNKTDNTDDEDEDDARLSLEELDAVTERITPFSIHIPAKKKGEPSENAEATPAQNAKAPVTEPSKPLVTEDMISTKTHIDAKDKPKDVTPELTPEEEREREKQALEQMYASYVFPPFSLLTPSEETDTGNITEEINANAAKLVETLTSFNVRTHITSVSRGPRITRYELVPDAGIRIRSIANLIDDISMNLASAGIRIEAPIPGKSAVGVEVPNKISSTVHLRELLETDTFKNAGPRTTVCVGADVTGDPVFCDLAKMPHMLIAGATGMGKSVCINTIIASILYKARPDELKLILVDPKKVELGVYNGIPHLLVPVVIDPKKAAGALSWAVCEMERRFDLIEEVGVRDLKGYNKEAETHPELEKLPHIIIIIDELNDLMMVASDAVEASICRIAQKARAAGIHLIIGTQRPSVDVITGTIKANIPSRIAFHVASQIDSRTILDTSGAEKLLNNGDMLFYPVGVPKPLRVQGAFISDSEVEKITSFLKQNVSADTYNRSIMEDIERETEKCAQNGKKAAESAPTADDREETLANPKFREAVEVAIDEGKISTSLIQRRLKLGFGKAARFIDIMQRMGIVSEPDGQKPRTTLITRDQYYDMLSRADDDQVDGE